MSKLSFRARALDASKPMPIYLAEELPDLPDYSAINRAVPQMPSGMEKEEESEHHLQRAISGTGLIIPTPEVCEVADLHFYERCYPADYKMPKQHIHMQPLWEEQETPEYDMDSEDERWLKQQHYPELTELLFEQMIDKLERCSGQNAVTLDEAKLLLQRADDTVIAVYDYWLNKRLSTREKRPYKRRKHRHHTSGVPPLRGDSGIYTSSEEESAGRAEAASPPDDGPFAFRRKAGCFYEMPTSTLCGDPVPDGPEGLFQHELDPRHRFTLLSLSEPYARCVGFARRRVARGGRVAIDRVRTPLHDLWPALPSADTAALRREEVEFETKAHRSPKEMVRDYHSSGKYPWRHAFRQHLAQNPHLWIHDVKPDVDELRLDVSDLKVDVGDLKVDVDFKVDVGDLKVDVDDLKMDVDVLRIDKGDISDLPQDSDISFRTHTHNDNLDKDIDKDRDRDIDSDSERERQVLDSAVRVNLQETLRERSYSPCSDSSYESDSSLHPVEKEFEKFISEVNRKWPHYRPVSRAAAPPLAASPPLSPRRPLAVSLEQDPPFTTAAFTLDSLMPPLEPLWDPEVTAITSDDHLGDNFGSSLVRVIQDKEPLVAPHSPPPLAASAPPAPSVPSAPSPVLSIPPAPAAPPPRSPAPPRKEPRPALKDTHATVTATQPQPQPQVQQQKQVKIDRRKSPERVTMAAAPPAPEEASPRPARRPAPRPPPDAPHIVTVAVSDTLKVRLQNHLASGSSSAIINGPYANARDHAVSMAGARRPLLQLGSPPRPLLHSAPVAVPLQHGKLKVVHAHSGQPTRALGGAVVTIPLEQRPAAIGKGAPVTQLFEIKGGQLGKGPHLVNVVRPPQPARTVGVGRLEIQDPSTRQLVTVSGAVTSRARGAGGAAPRVSVSLDPRQLVRAAPHHHIHINNRTFQLQASPRSHAPSPPLAVVSAAKPGSIPSAVVANLLHQKHMQLPKGGRGIAISHGAGPALGGTVQAVALSAAQLKARQARLITRSQPQREIVESAPSTSKATDGGSEEEGTTNGVRRRGPDTAMEVT